MTTPRDADSILRAWLDLMPDEAPDRTVAAVLQAVETTPQARRSIPHGPRRSPAMTRFALIAAAAALGVALVGGALLVGGGHPSNPPVPAPTPPPASPAATASPVVLDPVDPALRATWVANAAADAELGTGSGPVRLAITSAGDRLSTGNFGAAGTAASSLGSDGTDTVRVALERALGACPAGAEGTYRWTLSPDRTLLTLAAIDDPCRNRALELGRTWIRSLLGPTTVGAGVIDSMGPAFSVTLPDKSYSSRTLTDFAEIAADDGFSLMAFKNPQPFADPCSDQEERVPYQPGADAFVDHFRNTDAFTVSEVTELEIDGHRAVHALVGGVADYARCPGRELYQYTPKDCACHFVVGQGYTDSMYLVEVGEDTILFIISPPTSTEAERPIIESIRIPATIPTE